MDNENVVTLINGITGNEEKTGAIMIALENAGILPTTPTQLPPTAGNFSHLGRRARASNRAVGENLGKWELWKNEPLTQLLRVGVTMGRNVIRWLRQGV